MPETPTPVLKVLSSLDEVPSTDWDTLANPGYLPVLYDQAPQIDSPETIISSKTESISQRPPFNPMLSHAFLQALEESE